MALSRVEATTWARAIFSSQDENGIEMRTPAAERLRCYHEPLTIDFDAYF